MEESWRRMLKSLTRALKAEVEGQHFYRMAAASTRDPKGRKMFGMLAREERNHGLFLWAQFRSIIENEGPDATATLGARSALSDPSPIFSPGFTSQSSSAHFEVAALAIALRIELRSVRFYRNAARSTTDPAMRRFFTDLASWEDGHREAITRQLDSLRIDHWSTDGFTPL
jgi:rubrerythrin